MVKLKRNPITKITYIQLLLLHIGMGVLVYLAEFTSKFLFIGIFLYFLYRVFSSGNKKDEVLLAAGYIMGYEVFSRMTGGALTYEFAKYAVILFMTIGMFFKGFKRQSWPYAFYLLFLVPGILFSAMNLNYGTNVANAIGFNLSGPICLGIAALYCYGRKMPAARLQGVLLAILLPIVTTATYLYLYTPDLKNVLTNTESNFATSGGFGPNQVATILGLGMFILFSRFFLIKNRLVNIIDLSLLGYIGYRAIITFSRGGVITALACALIFLVVYFYKSGRRERSAFVPKVAFVAVLMLLTWIVSSVATMGLIDKRYANQDAAGREEQDITTGRTELLETELQAFFDNPITGIGIGKAKEFRLEQLGEYAASHNEVSRILSEHGIFGIGALGILMIAPLAFRLRNRSNIYFFSFYVFWFLTINHSSMRLAAPAFMYGLILIAVVKPNAKNSLRRKQA
ncbi:O-antigen ligase family protein [Flavobacteriaceae bacterium TK19130]|nr:O-antigen ligase family protein [Thermobacterium salinum]